MSNRSNNKDKQDAATFSALFGLFVLAGGMLFLSAMVLPQIAAFLWVIFGLVAFVGLHYILWGRWLSQHPTEEEEEKGGRHSN